MYNWWDFIRDNFYLIKKSYYVLTFNGELCNP